MRLDDKKVLGIVLMVIGVVLMSIMLLIQANHESQAVFMCEAVSENPALEMEDCPAHDPVQTWLITSGFIIAGIIISVGAYAYISSVERKEKKVSRRNLDSDEIKLIEILERNQGACYQSKLVEDTEFSKVKVTRILDKLEQKEIIERKRRGMSNLITIR